MIVLRETDYTFREATFDDYDFLFALHETTLREYIEVHWGWDENWQRTYFSSKFNPQARRVIQVNGEDVGVLSIEEKPFERYIAIIAILPQFQGRGIGTAVINDIVGQARDEEKLLTLHVLKSNLPAQRLYKRLGFQVIDEGAYHYKMAIKPTDTRAD